MSVSKGTLYTAPRFRSALTELGDWCRSRALTFLGGSRDADDVGDIRGQLGKKRNANSLPDPATDVPHQLWILFKETGNSESS